MIFDLNEAGQVVYFRQRVDELIEQKCKVELNKKRKRRSLSQNNYLHLILSWFGSKTGYSLEQVKQDIFKRIVCRSVFVKNTNGFEVCRSSADLNSKELTIAIEMFRNWSASEMGIPLPSPDEKEILQQIENEINRYGVAQYL